MTLEILTCWEITKSNELNSAFTFGYVHSKFNILKHSSFSRLSSCFWAEECIVKRSFFKIISLIYAYSYIVCDQQWQLRDRIFLVTMVTPEQSHRSRTVVYSNTKTNLITSSQSVLKGKKYKKTVSFYIMPSFCCNKFLVSHNITN